MAIGFAPYIVVTIDGEKGYWKGSDDCQEMIVQIIREKFIPARMKRNRTTTPASGPVTVEPHP
jgi:hypothetical protein